MQNGLFGLKIKYAKNVRKTALLAHYICSMQKTALKTATIGKMRAFLKWPKMATMQRLYSPCKILTLAQKIKLPKTCEKRFYKDIQVVLYKKRLQKTANIRKMRAF